MADNNKYQTQCPHCGIKFQITDHQLSLAKGNVRCGSCLQVFQATQHLVPLASTPPAGVGSARPPAPTAAPAAPARPAAPAIPPRPARPAAPPPPPAAPAYEADDDLADMILRELDESPQPAGKPVGTRPAAASPGTDEPQWAAPPAETRYGDAGETRFGLGGKLDDQMEDALISTDDPFGASSPQQAPITADSAADESWAKALIGETDDKEDRVSKFVGLTADKFSLAEQTGVQQKSAIERRLEAIARGEAPAAAPAPAPAPAARAPATAGAALPAADDEFDFLNESDLGTREIDLPDMEPGSDFSAPVITHEVSWGRDVLWATLSAVFLLLFGAQYLAYNMDTLARDDSWRGIYGAACNAFGCTLPDRSDVTRIQGANLVIRSHPTTPQALVVDAIVYNRAPFAQPFPRLELSFSNARGETVAGRVFTPDEYLHGELAELDAMPPDTPVHLTLELVDPGQDATGYALRFLPPPA